VRRLLDFAHIKKSDVVVFANSPESSNEY